MLYSLFVLYDKWLVLKLLIIMESFHMTSDQAPSADEEHVIDKVESSSTTE